MVKIGIFYDGGYFWHVSNYYNYTHPRRARLSITGIHEFIKNRVAALEGVDKNYCRIVDAHYFRGRFSAHEAKERNKLLTDRIFEDVLMKENVVTHFLPMTPRGEKGIDVWLALEAYELAIYKQFDVVVLIACDSDYVPLVRKLNTLGIRVMLLGWDFEYTDQNNFRQVTTTSVALFDEVTYPVLMQNVIDDKTQRNNPAINNLFLPEEHFKSNHTPNITVLSHEPRRNAIAQLLNGFGFLDADINGKNLFFHYSELDNCDFNDLSIGDVVEYKLGRNDRGECAIEIQKVEYMDRDEETEEAPYNYEEEV
ncbi:NYN domain-containing protein [Catalinimonas alkaloidigena]|uniref:NYN domain-containing protein n=1 Tax=Catalinimonas alkaloidigena TaxID=1075417 RepID=UPI001FE1C2C8|nr:NYN domain-containing protein [Catalinimonas alkaloidigena]